MEKATSDFNMASHAYLKLNDQERAAYNAIGKDAEKELRDEREDYENNLEARIKDAEEGLIQDYDKNLKLTPKGVVPPPPPGGDELRQMAIDRAREGHENRLKAIIATARKDERAFLTKTLGIENKLHRDFDRANRDLER